MKFSNILEKLEIILDLMLNSNIFIIFLLFIIFILLLKLTGKINNKKMGIFIYITELLVFSYVIYDGKNFLPSMFNKLIDNIFLNFYFPSVYVYLFISVISFIIFIYNQLNRYISKTYKIITNTYFFIYNFIFIILISIINTNNIDIFSKTSLFTNNNILVLLELSTLVFFLYLVIISLVYITNYLIMNITSKQVNMGNYDNNLEIINPNIEEENTYSKNMAISFQELVENSNKKNAIINLVPELSLDYERKFNNKINLVPEVQNSYKFIDPELLTEPFVSEFIKDNNANSSEKLNFIDFNILEDTEEDKITLKDYKLFSNMLKTVMKSNNNKDLTLEDILDKKIISKYTSLEYSKFEKILKSCLN